MGLGCPDLYPSGPPLWITPLWNGPTDAMEGVVRSYSASWSYGSTNQGLRVHKLPLKSYGGKPRHSILVGKTYGGKPRPDSRHASASRVVRHGTVDFCASRVVRRKLLCGEV